VLGVPDTLIDHATRAEQLAVCGIDADSIAARVRALVGTGRVGSIRETA
jgi:deoxyxylulose-5-phosphate synthase